MSLTRNIAEKLQLLANGGQLQGSSMKGAIVDELVADHIIDVAISGRTHRTYTISNRQALHNWLYNRFAINDLAAYIELLHNPAAGRVEMARAAANTKLRQSRAFTGFMLHTCQPLHCTLNGQPLLLQPQPGLFHFISDFERFLPPADVVIVGVENAVNFKLANRQLHLFPGIVPVFVSRYPQSQHADLIQWLQTIPNPYLHFGDLDFAGINIYYNEYKCHLGEKARFFVPAGLEAYLQSSGNPALYNQQKLLATVDEPAIVQLTELLHRYKKGLEQEVFAGGNETE
jgi:hypothetical protein